MEMTQWELEMTWETENRLGNYHSSHINSEVALFALWIQKNRENFMSA